MVPCHCRSLHTRVRFRLPCRVKFDSLAVYTRRPKCLRDRLCHAACRSGRAWLRLRDYWQSTPRRQGGVEGICKTPLLEAVEVMKEQYLVVKCNFSLTKFIMPSLAFETLGKIGCDFRTN